MSLVSIDLQKACRIETPSCKVTVSFPSANHNTGVSFQQNVTTKEFLGQPRMDALSLSTQISPGITLHAYLRAFYFTC